MEATSSSTFVQCNARDDIVCCVTTVDLALENSVLRQQRSERAATIADRDKTIAKLAQDVAKLQDTLKKLLAQRGGGHRVPEGHGLLFPEAVTQVEPTQPTATVDAEPDDGGHDDQAKPAAPKKKGTPRKPGKIDTTGLPSEDRLHDVPEDQRIDPVTSKPLVKIGEKVLTMPSVTCQRPQPLRVRKRSLYTKVPRRTVEEYSDRSAERVVHA